MQLRRRNHLRAVTLIEVVVAAAVLALTTVITTQSMLILNRNAALSRVRNLAKAMVLGKLNELAAVAYQPTATTPVVPSILVAGTTSSSVNLGDASTEVGTLPATMKWTVAQVGSTSTVSINCRLDYTLMGRKQSYEVTTYRARTNPRRAAFTLVEMSVAMAVAVAMGLTAFNVLRTGLVLSSQNLGINVSSLRGRTVIDQIGNRARYALEQPLLINSDGSAATGTTADGLLIKRFLGGPYVLKDASGGTTDLATTATQFVLEYRLDPAAPKPTLPSPQVGDCLLIESVTRPQVEISAVSVLAATATAQRRLVTVTSGIGELIQPSNYRTSAQLYRKEAYVFVNTSAATNPYAALRHFQRVKASTDFTSAANYQIMSSDFRRLNGGAYFVNSTSNSATVTTVQAVCNSSTRTEVVARNNAVSTYTSVPVQLRLWSFNR